MVLLETRQLMKHFGGIMAVNEISLSIGKGEILGMIGPNGSGKSTFVNLLTGIYGRTKARPCSRTGTSRRFRFTGSPRSGLPGHFKTFGYFRIFR